MNQKSITAIRASFLHFLNDPAKVDNIEDAYQYIADGILVTENGKVSSLTTFSQ